LTGTVIALWLLAAGIDAATTEVDEGPALTIDPCVDVDAAKVMDLELRDARAHNASLPASVSVRCVGEGQEIRIEPSSSPEEEGVRTIELPLVADDAAPAAHQARSRELALAIAELIRRLAAPPPPPPPPPPPIPALVVSPTRPPERSPARWQLGILPTFEYFTGGQKFAGGDLSVAARLHRWFFAELRAGGRVGSDQPLPGGRLTAWATTVGAAAGLVFLTDNHPVGGTIALRAQEYLVAFRTEELGQDGSQTARLGAFVLAAEPRLLVALTRRFSMEAAAAVGFTPHGIVVRTQGMEKQSTSGLLVSGSLGAVLTF
jgi:hypothetical protein